MESTVWLTKDQMASLRAQLERAREALQGANGDANPPSGDAERGRLRLVAIRSALMRVDNGTYGECVRCDEPLPFEALAQRPEAALCQSCEAERRGAR